MKLGDRGANLIKRYEGLRLSAYMPTPDDVPTIGWGHTKGVKMGDTITREQADEFFREDVSRFEDAVNAVGVPLTQAMFDALVSLTYNVGPGAISPYSTVGRALRSRNYLGAKFGFGLWVKQAGKTLRGLQRRRAEEQKLFMEDGLPSEVDELSLGRRV